MAAPKHAVGPKSDKLWRDALMRAVRRQADGTKGPQYLDRIADRVVLKAADGDIQAAKEIGDRLDGKPAQSLSIGQDESLGPITVRWEK